MKRCGKCGEEKALEDFYVDRRSKDGKTYACKTCIKATNAESKARVPIEVKRERWRKENKTEAGRARDRRYRTLHPDERREAKRRSREKNPTAYKESFARWYAENREAQLERRRATYDAEKKRISRDPIAGARYSAERRARMAGLPSEKIDRNELYKRDGGCCQICNEPVPEKGWEMDHIVPISLGGPHLWSNVRVTCRTCNRRKAARLEGQLALPAG